jgi:TorA maturation chaperone TorD
MSRPFVTIFKKIRHIGLNHLVYAFLMTRTKEIENTNHKVENYFYIWTEEYVREVLDH